MRAELLAIGSELLGPLRSETNTLWLTERLLDAGVEVAARVTLADDLPLVESALRLALKLPGYEPHAPFFKPLFTFITGAEDETLATQQLAGFLASARVCARTDDDKTLVLAAPAGRPDSVPPVTA